MSRDKLTSSIVDLYQNGVAVTKIAKRKRLRCSEVYKMLAECGMSASSIVADKRRNAAERVRGGEHAEAVALDCGRSMFWLRLACADHGVVCSMQSVAVPVRLKTFRVLAELQNSPKKTLEAIGNDRGVTRQRIGQILTEARTNGMLFPGRIFGPEKRPHCSIEL